MLCRLPAEEGPGCSRFAPGCDKFLHIQNAFGKGLPVIFRGLSQRCDPVENSPDFEKNLRSKSCCKLNGGCPADF